MPVLRVSEDVYRELQLRAVGLNDTPDSTLRRVLGIDEDATKGKGTTLFMLIQLYLAESSRAQKKHIMDEIRRRFTVCGWMLTK